MKRFFKITSVFVVITAILSCSTEGGNDGNDSMQGEADENIPQNSDYRIELSIKNESSYELTDVLWHGITFYSSTDGKTMPSGSVAKNSVEKDADGYVFFTRNGVVPAKLRSRDIVAASIYADKGYCITDDTLVAEVGNTKNTGHLGSITLSTPDYYTVSFESNGGSCIEPYIVQRGKEITVAPTLQMEGAAFAGWFSDAEFENQVDFPYVPESDAILYAEWKKPPEAVPFTGSRNSSTVTIQITPSDDKYFDHYQIYCYQVFGSLVTRSISRPTPSPPKLITDFETRDLLKEITGLTEKYYSVELYVVDKFGQKSEMYSRGF